MSKNWQREYRSLDIEIDYTEDTLQSIREAFDQYDFEDPKGILQYSGLPVEFIHTKPMRVGLTPLLKMDHLSDHLDVRLYLKSEGQNPSGCFKDRETMMCMLHALKKGLRKTTIFSSGNAAASAAIFAQKNGIHLIACVPGDTYREKINFIISHGADVIILGDEESSFEEGYRIFATADARGLFRDNGYDNWSVTNPFRVQGDKTTAVEIIRQLRDIKGEIFIPDLIIVPTANGSGLVGLWKGILELRRAGVIDSLPAMVSAGVRKASPIAKAVRNNIFHRPVRRDLKDVHLRDSRIGSIILASEGYDSIEAAKAVNASGGHAVEVTSSDIEMAYHLLLEMESDIACREDILPEPASLISIAAIQQLKKAGMVRKNDLVVSVITGSGVKARKKVEELIPDGEEIHQLVDEILERKKENQYPKAKSLGNIIRIPAGLRALRRAFLDNKK